MTKIIYNYMNEPIDMDTRKVTVAPKTIPITKEAFRKDTDYTALYWLGGGGFMINSRGTIILVDPTIETLTDQPMRCENGHPMLIPFPIDADNIIRCDQVLYTHNDGDHAGVKTAQKLAERDIPMMGSSLVFETLVKKEMKPYLFQVVHAGEEHYINDISLKIIPADHPWQLINEEEFGRPFYPEECVGYIVNTQDGGILFTGDSRLIKEHVNNTNIVVIPLDTSNCSFHLGRSCATLLANKYINAYLIPYHYGTFDMPIIPAQEGGDPQFVLNNVKNSKQRARIVAPGQPFMFRKGKEYKVEN